MACKFSEIPRSIYPYDWCETCLHVKKFENKFKRKHKVQKSC